NDGNVVAIEAERIFADDLGPVAHACRSGACSGNGSRSLGFGLDRFDAMLIFEFQPISPELDAPADQHADERYIEDQQTAPHRYLAAISAVDITVRVTLTRTFLDK